MSTLKETVYAGRNNAIRVTLLEDGVLLQDAYPDMTPTRWVLTIHATTTVNGATTDTPIVVDSDSDAGVFDWDATTSVLELQLGGLLSEALDFTLTSLVMYAAEWPTGLVWFNPTCTPDKLLIRVCSLT